MRKFFALAAMGCIGLSGVHASTVTCGSSDATQLRVVTLTPGLAGGFCYTQLGNFNPAEAVTVVRTFTGGAASTVKHLDKDDGALEGNPLESWLTGYADATSGNWTVAQAAWDAYDSLFLGFHFGNNGGAGAAADPDSFIVQLARANLSGTWSLGGVGASLNGLSHIDLIGSGPRGGGTGANGNGNGVPEPASLALVGLGLLGAAATRRRRA